LFFSVAASEGNYRLILTLGHAERATRTTLRIESGRLLAADLSTAPGEIITRTFIGTTRRPELPPPPKFAPGGSRVHMFLPGEAESRLWDDKLTLEFNTSGPERPALVALEIIKDDTIPSVFFAGDSTVADPRTGPGGNWPTQLPQFFQPTLAFINAAEGGETSKSFITGYRFDKVLGQLKPGDFFFIQFGHNDSKLQWPQTYTEPGTTFDAYLRVFIAEIRRCGATPIFVTPMERRSNGDTVGRWARAMQEVAAAEDVPLIDQWSRSKRLWTALGPAVPTAFADGTHLSDYGGYLLARLMAGSIAETVPALAAHLRDDFTPMSPEAPEPIPLYLSQAPAPR
jgi:lysophospholipase L1-like esterase